MKNCILIVDDDPNELRAMELVLKEIGVDVCCADSAAKARILMDKIKPDLILTDVMMPVENGFEFCRQLKNSDSTKEIPVIFLTGLEKTENIVKGFGVGGDDYLLKPISIEELRVRVKNHLKTINLQTSLKTRNEELKQAKDALRENDYLLSNHLLNTPVGAISWDLDFKVVDWNPAAENIFGYTKNEAIGKHVSDIIVPDNMKELVNSIFQDLISEKGGIHSTNENITRDGRRIICDWYNTALKDVNGKIIGLTAFVHDITERINNESALQKTRKLLNEAQELGNVGFWEFNPCSGEVYWTPNLYKMFGYKPEEVSLTHLFFVDNIVHPDDRSEISDQFQKIFSDKQIKKNDFRAIRKDGQERIIRSVVAPELDESGKIIRVYGSNLDITEQKKAEDALKQNENRYKSAQRMGKVGNWEYDILTKKFWGSAEAKRIYGFDPESKNFTTDTVENCIPDRDRVHQALVDLIEKRQPYDLEFEIRPISGPDKKIINSIAEIVDYESGIPTKVAGVIQDITDRKLADMALQASHKQFLRVLDGIDATIYVVDMKTYEILFMNKYMKESFGRDFTGEICWEVYRGESKPCMNCPNDKLCDENGKPTEVFVWHAKNPVTGRWYINYDRAIEWTGGRLVKLQIATDITDLKRMEEELRQVRKLESIGTLTKGIAHDFNNIMGIILGNTELALEDVPESNRAYSNLEAIKTASRRAANIVKQLSNLSRITDRKLQPIEIARVIKDALTSLRSTIPNTIDIQQDIQITNETILANPIQMKQMIMDLAINASDAMEQTSGNLTISVEKVILDDVSAQNYPDLRIGKYIKILVGDTGPGIDPEIIDRIFDPYFTTKGVGKGSGMGLAVVHSIVKSHSGSITVDSTLGKGTKFIMFFPLVTEKPIVEVKTT